MIEYFNYRCFEYQSIYVRSKRVQVKQIYFAITAVTAVVNLFEQLFVALATLFFFYRFIVIDFFLFSF